MTPEPGHARAAAFQRHGGRLAAAMAAYPDAPRPWLDLSTGVNPYPYPLRFSGRSLARLPQPEDRAALEHVAAEAFGIPDSDRVAATPGSEVALRLLPSIIVARDAASPVVAIAGPTYGGHAEAWTAAGARIVDLPFDDIGAADAEIVVIVNPNNPDGRTFDPAAIRAIARRQARRGGWVIVDEAFAEVAPGSSVAADAGGSLVVLRSFGKFYGLPGLRLGFVLGDRRVIDGMRATLGDWPVSTSAIEAGLTAYPDNDWADRMRLRLIRAAARLDRALARSGFSIAGGTSLFRLARCQDAASRFAGLAARGILTRPFTHDSGLLRFGLPRGRAQRSRLVRALEETKS